MKTIVAADIHGVSAPLRALLAPLFGDVVLLSPWAGEGCPYASESQAHAAFIAARGVLSYAARIAQAAGDEPAFIVAFSVGASAAWLYAASDGAHPRSVATLFYGSRIRDHGSLAPKFDVTAVFAQSEASFCPAELARRIAGGRVRAYLEAGTAHGFMNPLSANYRATLAAAYLERLAKARALLRRQLA